MSGMIFGVISNFHAILLSCYIKNFGYSELSLMRAWSVVNRQSTPFCFALHFIAQAMTSSRNRSSPPASERIGKHENICDSCPFVFIIDAPGMDSLAKRPRQWHPLAIHHWRRPNQIGLRLPKNSTSITNCHKFSQHDVLGLARQE